MIKINFNPYSFRSFGTVGLLLLQQFVLSQTITYQPLYTSGTFTKTVNTALATVVSPTNAEVSGTGAAVYNIPIAIPPGTNGVAPQLAISYNSQTGDGPLGWGWNISGLSIITRVSNTHYFDFKHEGVKATLADKFALDGMRLQGKTGTYGTAGSTYATESESFATITANGTWGNGPQWFSVVTKEGLILEFGNTTDSRFVSGATVLYWRLNRIKHPDGNYIDLKYTFADQDWRIDEVNYTGNTNTGLAPYNKIKFNYLIRSDVNTKYETGTTIRSKYLLDKIVVTAESAAAFKEYRLNYGYNNRNSFLREVTEVGTNGTLLNSTIFKYGDTPVDFQTSSSAIVAGQAVDLFAGDFDADGYSDIMAATYAYSNNVKYHTEFKIYKRTASSSTYTLAATQSLPTTYTIIKNQSIPSPRNFFVADFNGDGADDVVTTTLTLGSSYHTLINSKVYLSNGSGTAFTATTLSPYTGFPRVHTNGNNIFPGDFNGDGIRDLFLLAGTTSNSYQGFLYHGGSGSGFLNIGQTGTYTLAEADWVNADQIHVTDFNGDGKSELMIIKNSVCEIFQFTSDFVAEKIYAGGFPTKDHRVFFGDFNGDGKTDLLAKYNPNGIWYKAISTGTSYPTSTFTFSHTPSITGSYSDDKLVISDYNGDGRTDIMHAWNYFVGGVASTSKIDLYYSQGDNFQYLQHSYGSILGYMPAIAYDLNGDGRSDIVTRVSSADPFNIFYFNKEGKELMLDKVKNGIDHNTQFVYKRMTEAGTFYTRGTIGTSELRNFQLPMYLVYDFKQDNGIGGTTTIRHAYEEAKLHRKGKGFLGMKKVTADNLALGMKTSNELEFNTTYYAAAPYRTSTYLSSTSALLRQNTLTNEFVSQGTKRYFLRVNSSYDDKAFEGRYVSTTNTYDAYGNITQKVSNNSGAETTTTTSVYGSYGTPVPAKPTSITASTTRTGQPTFSVATTYAYNTLGQLTSEIKFPGQSKSLTKVFTYNTLGNQSGVTMTPGGQSVRSISWGYDSKGRFPTSFTNELGQTATMTYDVKWGKPLTTVGVDGLSTTYVYDAWGRLTSTTTPDGFNITEVYDWDINTTERTIHYHTTQHPAAADVKIWYDLMGREKKQQTEGFQSLWATQVRTYDAKGNVVTQTNPYKSGESVLTTTYGYDTYNRPSSMANTLGTTTFAYSYAAGALTTTVTKPGSQVSSSVTDAAERTTSATDYGGTLTYTYHSSGNLLQVKQGATVLSTNEYDLYGRQSKLIDPDAGTTLYNYDALGQLTSQTNAHSQASTMTYDLLGRVTQRVGPEGTTLYEYFPSASGASTNQIKKITGFSGNLEEFTYTTKGYVATKKETVDGVAHTSTYGWDTYGRMTSLTYASGLAITYAYDGSGQITTIQQGTTTLFTNTGMNGYGQYTSYSLGDGKTTQKTYYFGFPTRFYAAGVQDLNLSWNYQTGNLNSRNDAIKGKTESFTYDNLNRLTSGTISGQSALNTTYAANGNISTKWDAGTYTHSSTKIHAAVKVTNPQSVIPTVTQDITYTAFYQPATVTENGYQLTYTYAADHERVKSVLQQSTTTLATRYYFDGYEKVISGGVTKYVHYIGNGDGIVATVIRQGTTNTFYYVYTDQLGSILTTTNPGGTIAFEQNFDAWGRKRHPSTWAYTGLATNPDWLYRGYTGHEEMPQFGLINMNGRVYDPVLGRMLSPDNFNADPFYSQNFNRFAYANNNPLLYADPDGEFAWIPFVIGAVIGGISGHSIGKAHGATGWGMFAYIAGGAAIGGLSAAAGAAVTSSLGASITSQYGGLIAAGVGGATGGALAGGGFAGLAGGNVLDGAWKGAVSGLVGASLGSYISGGAGAFVGGAAAGGISAALNDENVGLSALVGGAISFGSYQLTSAVNYRKYTKAGGALTRNQFNAMSRAAQKSFTRGREYGGWLLGSGDVEMWRPGSRAGITPTPKPAGAIGFFHTHPNIGGAWIEQHSPPDMSYNNTYARVSSFVIGRQNYYSQLPLASPTLVHSSSYFSPYPYNYYWWKFLSPKGAGVNPGN